LMSGFRVPSGYGKYIYSPAYNVDTESVS